MNFSAFDHRCMAEAVTLARRGLFSTMPNPRVGCVLARDGHIVGRGWHEKAGEAHAERRALDAAGAAARGATAYVTLEPCSHQGRTGPCADALLAAEVAEVIVAMRDPNPQVDGGGMKKLEAAGVRCRSGLLAAEAEALNPGFISRMRRARPWVRGKLALSLDGRTALANGDSQWITGPAARQDVQRWRGRACAVLTGIETVLADDPSLNLRLETVDRQPLRVIVDSHWRTPPTARTLALPGEVLIAGNDSAPVPDALQAADAELLRLPELDGRVDLAALLAALARREVNELHVEAGGTLCGSLLRAGLLDELLVYQAPCVLGEAGRPGLVIGELASMKERPAMELLDRVAVGSDLRMRFRPLYGEN